MPLLKLPVMSKIVHRFGNEHVHGAVIEMNGWRDHMEDAHAVVLRDNVAFVGVFDGHAGGSCARYLRSHLPDIGFRCAFGGGNLVDECQALDDTFLRMEKNSGSTATFAILSYHDNALEVANVGDSRTMLIRDGKIHFSTQDHKPDVPSEVHRVTRAGGEVDFSLEAVRSKTQTHILRMTRSFGDKDFKNAPTGNYVSSEPEVKSVHPMKDDYLLVCCDGILEGLKPEEIARLVKYEMQRTNDPALALSALCDAALHGDSSDNLSAVLLCFGPTPEGRQQSYPQMEIIPGPVHSNTSAFVDAYAFMAARGGLTLPQALAIRAQHIKNDVKQTESGIAIHRMVPREKRLLKGLLMEDHDVVGDLDHPSCVEAANEIALHLTRKMTPGRAKALEAVQRFHRKELLQSLSASHPHHGEQRHHQDDHHAKAERVTASPHMKDATAAGGVERDTGVAVETRTK